MYRNRRVARCRIPEHSRLPSLGPCSVPGPRRSPVTVRLSLEPSPCRVSSETLLSKAGSTARKACAAPVEATRAPRLWEWLPLDARSLLARTEPQEVIWNPLGKPEPARGERSGLPLLPGPYRIPIPLDILEWHLKKKNNPVDPLEALPFPSAGCSARTSYSFLLNLQPCSCCVHSRKFTAFSKVKPVLAFVVNLNSKSQPFGSRKPQFCLTRTHSSLSWASLDTERPGTF